MATGSGTTAFQTVNAETGKAVKLAMQGLELTGRILPVGARLLVRHVFRSAEKRPLEAIYSFMLPRDAALRRFRVEGDGFSVRSELKPAAEAVRTYETGIEAGRLAALAREYGDGVVNLTLGNIRPGETVTVLLEVLAGVELRDDGLRFRFPFALAPAYHPRARACQGEMELPEDIFGDVVLPRWVEDASGLHTVGFDLEVEMAREIEEIGSPSHPLRVRRNRVTLATAGDRPDRDLVLDVRSVAEIAAVRGKDRFAAVIPSSCFGRSAEGERRLAVVLDRSGSMTGEPIAQARKAIEACLGALSRQDWFGLIAFDDEVEEFRPALARAGREERRQAREFLAGVNARGGTELAQAIRRAARMLGGGGDVLVLTDGQVSGTEDILAVARAAGIRIHTLGIGSASQDRFLSLLAGQTGGVGRFVTPRERVDLAAVDLFAAIGRPVATGLRAPGALPEPPAAVFAGTPVALFGEGAGPLEVAWNGGSLTVDIASAPEVCGETLRLLLGAKLLANAGEDRLRALSEEYGLASRAMALVAVVERAGDRPGELPKTVIVPVGMPQDVEFGSYFDSSTHLSACLPAMCFSAPPPGLFSRARASAPLFEEAAPSAPEDDLMELAARMEPDGGMPGEDDEERAEATLAALLKFAAAGHTTGEGAFRTHVRRLVDFLQSLTLPPDKAMLLLKAIRALEGGGKLPPPSRNPWAALARM